VIQAPIVQRFVLKILSSSRKVTFILGRPNDAFSSLRNYYVSMVEMVRTLPIPGILET